MNIRCLGALLLAATTGHVAAAVKPGYLDESFGFGGRQIIPVDMTSLGEENAVTSLIGPEGKIYIVGSSRTAEGASAMTILRMKPSGEIDEDFGKQGVVVQMPQGVSSAVLQSATFDTENRLVVAGAAVVQAKRLMITCRFTSEGALDPQFGAEATPGCYTLPIDGGVAHSVLVQNVTGRIILAGSVISGEKNLATIFGLLPDGSSYSPVFGEGLGLQFISDPNFHGFPTEMFDLAQDSAGNLAATGVVKNIPLNEVFLGDYDIIIASLSADGAMQESFSEGGVVASYGDFGGVSDRATAVSLLEDGSIIFVGFGQVSEFEYRPIIGKFFSTGHSDVSFTYDGALLGDALQAYNLCEERCDMRAEDVDVLPNGNVVIAGTLRQGTELDTSQTLPGRGDFFALRLLPSGVPDPTFRSVDSTQDGLSIIPFDAYSEPPEDSAFSLTQQGDRLLVAGLARTDNTPDNGVPDFSAAITRIGNGDPIFADGFE